MLTGILVNNDFISRLSRDFFIFLSFILLSKSPTFLMCILWIVPKRGDNILVKDFTMFSGVLLIPEIIRRKGIPCLWVPESPQILGCEGHKKYVGIASYHIKMRTFQWASNNEKLAGESVSHGKGTILIKINFSFIVPFCLNTPSIPWPFGWAVWHSCRMGYRNQWQIRGRKAPNFGWATLGWASCNLCPLCIALDLA